MDTAIATVNKWIHDNDPDKILFICGLEITELPDIPLTCTKLVCAYNKLIKLPDLPQLVELDCQRNKLTKLPELPNCVKLNCHDNLIKELPSLPMCTELFCGCNELKTLPKLPMCEKLYCFNNQLTEISGYDKVNFLVCFCNKLNSVKNMPKLTSKITYFFNGSFREGNTYLHIDPKILKITAYCGYNNVNYNLFAIKIQTMYRMRKRRQTFNELHKNYIKNISSMIVQYVI